MSDVASRVQPAPGGLEAARRQLVRLGLVVVAGLALLTLLEYIVAVQVDANLAFLLPFVFAKSLLILQYFMHIRQLWDEGGH